MHYIENNAINSAGGRENWDKLNHEQKYILAKEAFTDILNNAKNGEVSNNIHETPESLYKQNKGSMNSVNSLYQTGNEEVKKQARTNEQMYHQNENNIKGEGDKVKGNINEAKEIIKKELAVTGQGNYAVLEGLDKVAGTKFNKANEPGNDMPSVIDKQEKP